MSDIPPIGSGAEFVTDQLNDTGPTGTDPSAPTGSSGISSTIDSIVSEQENSEPEIPSDPTTEPE